MFQCCHSLHNNKLTATSIEGAEGDHNYIFGGLKKQEIFLKKHASYANSIEFRSVT